MSTSAPATASQTVGPGRLTCSGKVASVHLLTYVSWVCVCVIFCVGDCSQILINSAL